MTLGRTDDPENPLGAQACQSRRSVWGWIADPIWASGHAPREKAGHMIAIDPPVRFLIFPLASKGPPTHAPTPRSALRERRRHVTMTPVIRTGPATARRPRRAAASRFWLDSPC